MKKDDLNTLSIPQLIDILNSRVYGEDNKNVINERGEYYKLCGKVSLNPDCDFIKKVKDEIDEWKNEDIELIKNKNYDDNICNKESFDFIAEQRNEDVYEREYSNEYLKLVAQISGCNSLVDFCSYKQYEHIVTAAYKNGIIDELLPNKYKRQRCNCKIAIENAKKCNSRTELANRYSGSYTICKRIKGLFDDLYGKINHHINASRGYWMVYENRYNAAKECKTITEYRTKYPTAYINSLYAEELHSFNWLNRNDRSYNNEQRTNVVYCYIDKNYEIPTVYIGRTYENVLRERMTNHKHDENDAIYKWFTIKRNIDIPEPIILMKNLTLKESQYWENEYVKKYSDIGYNVLNIAQTGINHSSTGGSILKWTYYNVFREMIIYEYRKDFKNRDGSAYVRANNNKWTKDAFWFKETYVTNLIKKNTDINKQECWANERISFFVCMFENKNNLKKYNTACYNFINETNQFDTFYNKQGTVKDDIRNDEHINHTLSLLKEMLICIIETI